MQFKVTNKLFNGKYQHKVVLICAGASLFRGSDMDAVITKLDKQNVEYNFKRFNARSTKIRTQEELDYAFQIAGTLKRVNDQVDVRVESPWLSIYTNDKRIIDTLVQLDETKIKYVSSPPAGVTLEPNTIIMSKRDFDYRITLGRTYAENSSFVDWANVHSDKVQLTASCKRQLLQAKSSGGSHFYLTGDNVLLMAKMHLGGSVAKVERITKK